MRSIIIFMALVLAMAWGTALALPLEGSNENATAVIFASSRVPVEDNATLEILKVDVGLMGAENASYQLLDQDGLVHSAGRVESLSSGRQIVYFLSEMDRLFKLINVTPDGSDPIYIKWWMTPNASNDKLKVRYYGIVDNLIYSAKPQEIVLQVSVENIGSENINLTPFNFTLLDQWQWHYLPTEANFDPEVIGPGDATDRLLLAFYNLSPAVRPAYLVYDLGAPDQIVIDLEKDFVPLSDELVYGNASVNNANDTSAQAEVENVAPEAQSANQTEEAVAPEQAPESQNGSIKLSALDEKIAASKARLNAKMGELDKKNQESSDAAISTAAANNSTAATATSL